MSVFIVERIEDRVQIAGIIVAEALNIPDPDGSVHRIEQIDLPNLSEDTVVDFDPVLHVLPDFHKINDPVEEIDQLFGIDQVAVFVKQRAESRAYLIKHVDKDLVVVVAEHLDILDINTSVADVDAVDWN